MKKNNGVAFIILILFLGFLMFYLSRYHEWETTPIKEENYQIDEPVKEDNKDKEKKISNEDATKIYDKYKYTNIESLDGSTFKDIYYKGLPFSNEYIVYISIYNIISEDIKLNCNLKKEISAVDVDNKVKELFGNIEYEKVSFTSDKFKITYDEDFTVEVSSCDNLTINENYVGTEYYDNKILENKLIITEIAYYVAYDFKKFSYDYYSDVFGNGDILGHDLNLIDKNKLSKYNYIFGIKGNNYYLENIVRY